MAVPLMPQWISCGEGVPVGASSETVLVAVTTVVGTSDGVVLAVSIGGRDVTMTSPVEVAVEVATSMGLSDGLMTSDAEDDVVIGGTMTVVGSSVVVGGSSVAVGSGTDVTLAKVVMFPGTSVGKGGVGRTGVGKTVTLTSGVLMLGKDVKFEGTTTGGTEYEIGGMV